MRLILLFILASIITAGQLSSDGGRFVFGQISDYRRDQYLLDTQTGRLWEVVTTKDSMQVLQPIMFRDYADEQWYIDYCGNNKLTITPTNNQGK